MEMWFDTPSLGRKKLWNSYAFWAAVGIGIGIVFRLVPLFMNRAFWLDEASIALNIRFRTFAELFQPLDYEQTMPIPLLLLIKLLTGVLGTAEYVFRFPALLAGVALLFAIWFSFSELFGRAQAFIAVLFAAFWQPLIYYSSEVKQYEVDALITVFLLWMGLRVLRDSSRNYVSPAFIVIGVIAILVSQPSVFILAGFGAALVFDLRFRQSNQFRLSVASAGALWLGLFIFLFYFSYKETSNSAFMRLFWADYFIDPKSPLFLSQVKEFLHTLCGTYYFRYMRMPIVLPLFALGLYGIFRSEGWRTFIVAFLPFCLLFVAAFLREYPFSTRLYLFAVPLTIWIFSSSIVTFGEFFSKTWQAVVFIAVGLALVLNLAMFSFEKSMAAPLRETARQTVAYIQKIDENAPVYLAFGRYRTWAYYTGNWKDPQGIKKNLDMVESCETCDRIVKRGRQTDIIGNPPEKMPLDEWAKHETARLLAVNQEHVWTYLPVYPQELKAKGVWERLNAELAQNGLIPETTYSLGDSLAVYYRLPSHQCAVND